MKKLIVIFGMGGLILLVGSVAAWQLGLFSKPGSSSGAKPESSVTQQAEMGPTVKLSPMVINLKEETGRSYLKATIILEMEKKDGVEEVNKRISSLTDMVILTLSDKRMEDLKEPESKEKLKQEILSIMNQHLPPKTIRQIYFDEFLYQ